MGTVLVRGERVVVQWVDATGCVRQRSVKKRRADGGLLSVAAREREARRIVAELEEQAERQRFGLAPRPLKNPRCTFGDLHAHWEATRGASVRSRTFVAFVRPHIAELFDMPALDVTTTTIDRLLTKAAAHLAPKSVMHIRGHLHAVYEASRVQGGPWEGRENPVTAARKFKVPEQFTTIISPAEWPVLASEVPAKWRAHVAVAFFTGLRRGDVFALRKRDVDLARGTISATISKAQKARTLPIADGLRPYLEGALAAPGPLLFAWPKGKRLPNLVKMLRRACGRAGLITGYEWRCRRRRACGWTEEHASADVPDACPSCGRDTVYARPIPRRLRFHDLRHSFGTAVVAAGGTGAGQALLAHSDPRMTERYTHLADAHLGGVIAKAFGDARAAPVLRFSGGPPSNVILLPVPQRKEEVGPPGIEPGLRSRGRGF